MPDLEGLLRDHGRRLDRHHPEVTVDEVLARVEQRADQGHPERRRLVLVAAVVSLLLGSGALLFALLEPAMTIPVIGEVDDTPAGVGGGATPLGIVTTIEEGVLLVPFDSTGEPPRLEAHPVLRDLLWALPDQRGGLIFQHDLTPEPWPPGAILWLRAGAPRAEVLVEPTRPSAPGEFPRAGVRAIGVASSPDGHALFVHAVPSAGGEASLMVADLDDDGASREIARIGGMPSPDWDFADHDVLVGGDVVGILDTRESSCHTLTLLRAADGSPLPATTGCLHGGPRALSHDGRTMATLGGERGEDVGLTRSEEELLLTVTELETGATLRTGSVMTGRWNELALVPTPGGWLTYVESSGERRLLDLDGNVVDRIADGSPSPSSSVPGPVFYDIPFDLALEAPHRAEAQRPCPPSEVELPRQDLPGPVERTRQRLFDLASSCDYEGLAAMAQEHAPRLTAGGTSTGPPWPFETEDQLIDLWITEGIAAASRSPDLRGGYRSPPGEPLSTLAGLLTAVPAHVEDIPYWPVYFGAPHPDDADDDPDPNPPPDGCVWLWSLVPAEPDGEPVEVDLWQAHRDAQVGIAPDGTWRFHIGAGWTEPDAPRPPPCTEGDPRPPPAG
jgi:hypothetical protein